MNGVGGGQAVPQTRLVDQRLEVHRLTGEGGGHLCSSNARV